MNKVLLDTNVLIYALDASSGYHQRSVALLTDPNAALYLTTKNITEFFAVCSKLGVNFKQAFDFYAELRQNAILLFPDSVSVGFFEALLLKYNPKGNRVFDVEIASIMQANGLRYVATFNAKDFIPMTEMEVYPSL